MIKNNEDNSVKDTEVVSVKGLIGFSRYQAWQYALAFLPIIFTSMSNTNFIFAAADIEYRCIVPECDTSNVSLVIPKWWPATVPDARCSRPIVNLNSTNASCDASSFTNFSEICDSWIYKQKVSIVSEFGLACQDWKRSLVGTIHNIGVLISMPMMGFISDRWGRKTAIIMSSVSLSTGALKTLADTFGGYPYYLIIELLEAALATGSYTTCFVLMMELTGKEKRAISSVTVGICIALGELALGVIVWNVPYWKHFQLIVYCPALLFLSYIFLLDESLRWLLINGKNERVLQYLKKITSYNGIKLPDKVVEAVKCSKISLDSEVEVPTEKINLSLLFASATVLKRLLVCSWWWFATAFVYYGLLINSVSLPGNKITNFMLSAVVTIPADLMGLVALQKVGRKMTLLFSFLFCGICCVGNGFIPNSMTSTKIAMFLMGKMYISVCFNVIYIYTSELMPTSARSSLVGTCSMMARLGSILAPLTPLLSVWWQSLPTIMFGCVALTASMMALSTPETLGKPLPDTVAQAEKM